MRSGIVEGNGVEERTKKKVIMNIGLDISERVRG